MKRVAILVLMLLSSHLGLLWTFDLAGRPIRTLLWFTLAVGSLVLLSLRPIRFSVRGPLLILSVAAGLRLFLLPVPPSLSDDIYRYIWDGRVTAAGLNPYQLAPNDAELIPLRDDLWRRLPHRDIPTVYPPVAMGLFSIAARLPNPVFVLKSVFTALDLTACALLLTLARRLGRPDGSVIWYAWNPLVTLEIAGMGHVDAVGIAAIVAGLVALHLGRRGGVGAGFAAAAAALTKLVPLLVIPAWARMAADRSRFLWATMLVLLIVGLPTLLVTGIPAGVVAYGVSWEFNGPIYEPLWRAIDALQIPTAIEKLLDVGKSWTGRHDLWNRLYPFNYARLLAKWLLAIGLLAAIVKFSWKGKPLSTTGKIFGAMILTSATVYPWYLLWILPWAALERRVAWLTLGALAPISYLPQFSDISLLPWVYLVMWTPFAILLLLERRWSTP